MLRVILEPLIGDAPLVGGVTFFFIRRPVSAYRYYFNQVTCQCIHIYVCVCVIIIIIIIIVLGFFPQTLEINWTGATNLLDTPAFRLVSIKKSP